MKQVWKIGALGAGLLLASATGAMASIVGAGPQYIEGYSGTSTINVYNILTANAYPDTSEGFTQAGQSITPPTFAFSDPFLKDSKILSTNTFFFGESTDTIITSGDAPPDPPGTVHLIVATELAYSQGAIGQDFSSAFPDAPSEASILAAIDTLYANGSSDDDQNAARTVLFNFIGAANADGALFATTGGSYNLVSFSTGAVVGSGVAAVTQAGVPEPASWALMLLGFGGLGAALRRRNGVARVLG